MAFIKIFRFRNFPGSFFPFSFKIKRANHAGFIRFKIFYNMKTVYFYNTEGEEKVYITFQFSEFNMNKIFSFERNIAESLDSFLQRFKHKLQLSLTKQLLKKTEENEEQNQPDFNALILLNNERIRSDLLFKDIFQKDFNGNLKLKVFNNEYDVIINAPMITNLKLPKVLQVGCIVTPGTVDSKFTDIKKSDFVWYRSMKPNQLSSWVQCGQGFCYKIQEDDINHNLKLSCTPKTDGKIGPIVEAVSQTTVTTSDNLTEILARHEYTKEKTNSEEFRIVSYNILADLYLNTKEAKTQIFLFCDPLYLDFEYRKNLLNFEILGYNADLICLQELERKLYNCNLNMFNEMGYECVYFEKEGAREGNGLLYSRNKFNILDAKQYVFTKELLNNPMFNDIYLKIKDNTELMSRLTNIASQIQVVVLESVKDNILVVGNVHFYFHPDADHIRLLQGILALRILLKTYEAVKEEYQDKKVSILLCGDFNSTPECGFHQLLQEGTVSSDHIDWNSKKDEIITDVSFSHSLNLKSSYDNEKFTNYIPSFKGCLDYIYFQADHLQLKQTVPIPSEEVLSRYQGIPSKFFPSDHVALIADFKFNNDSN